MNTSIFENDDTMPAVVKKAYSEVLPRFVDMTGDDSLPDVALDLAAAFGDTGEFNSLLGKKAAGRDESEKKLVDSFQKNIELLVQKTWVEKADESMKEEVIFRIKTLCINLFKYDYHTALSEFLPVLHDVVYLLFGSSARQDSFLEYAVRIDPDFGFFWYYIKSLPPHKDWSEEKCRVAVLLGIYFLANF